MSLIFHMNFPALSVEYIVSYVDWFPEKSAHTYWSYSKLNVHSFLLPVWLFNSPQKQKSLPAYCCWNCFWWCVTVFLFQHFCICVSWVDPRPPWATQPQLTQLVQILRCVSCEPPTFTWPYSLPPQWIPIVFLPWQESHTYFFSLPLSLLIHLPPSRQNIVFFLSLEHDTFWLRVWSHCKYFQYSVTISKSLHSLPGGKQNSHLRFSCGAFSANIIAARPPPSSGTKTIHLSILLFLQTFIALFSAKSSNCRLSLLNYSVQSCSCKYCFSFFQFLLFMKLLYATLWCSWHLHQFKLPLFQPPPCLSWHCGTKGLTLLITNRSLTCRVPDCLNSGHCCCLWQIYDWSSLDRKPCNL